MLVLMLTGSSVQHVAGGNAKFDCESCRKKLKEEMLPLLLWDNARKEEATPPPTHGAGRIPHRLISQSCLFLQKELLVESFWGLKMSPVKSQFHLCSVSLWTGNKSVKFAPLKGIYGPVGMLYESVTAWSKGDTLCGQREVQFLPSFPIF